MPTGLPLSFGNDVWAEQLEELKKKEKVCLLKEGRKDLTTLSGLIDLFNDKEVMNNLFYPDFNPIPWDKKPKFNLRPFQTEAVSVMKESKHCAVSLPTGCGKSIIALQLIKEIGLQTVVMAPSVNIAKQLYKLFATTLGKKKVGMFGGGKREFKKLVTIGIDDSLTRVESDSEEWEVLSKAQVFLADESHLVAADTLERVCSGLCGNAPYRYFISATQMRNDRQ